MILSSFDYDEIEDIISIEVFTDSFEKSKYIMDYFNFYQKDLDRISIEKSINLILHTKLK